MALSSVAVSSAALEVCLAHALSTESEEIMGLLLGDLVQLDNDELMARVWSVSLQRREQAARSDDRVEISPEQLAAATEEAERLGEHLGRPTRVVGWYHSHPHLAVVPSHVDVSTQAMYQQMDTGFIGLIFSVFNSGRVVPGVPTGNQVYIQDEVRYLVSMGNLDDCGRVQVTAFQSTGVDADGEFIPANRPQSISNRRPGESVEREKSVSVAKSYIQKEVPITIIPSGKFFDSSPAISCLDKLSLLQNILREEEKHAYEKSLKSDGQEPCHLLTQLHNSAVYQKGLCRIIETCQLPLLSALEAEIQSAEDNLKRLRREKEELKVKIAASRKEFSA